MANSFNGIEEKLKRSDENIINLDGEITIFFQRGEYPVIPHPDDKLWQKALDYHQMREIPLRFSVLAGEIVHHLRSSLDHIVWHFSDDTGRRSGATEFPVFKMEPISEKELARYEGKIQGVKDFKARNLIEEFQPYKVGANAPNHFLSVVHDMDRFDKHRELVMVSPIALLSFSPSLADVSAKVILYQQGKLPVSEIPAARRAMKEHGQVAPQVAFRKVGQLKDQPVVPALRQLAGHVRNLVSRFAGLA